jgi:uncharacterized membrane protein
MSETRAEQDRARDFDRFLTFIDAIVAIAINLLVLPLVDLAGELADGGSVRHLVGDNQAPIGAFFLSFVVIADLWLTQHRVLRHVVAADEWLIRLLMLWTVTIVFLPFPTALVSGSGGAGDQATTKLLYVGTMTLSSLVLGLVSLEVARHGDLRDSDETTDPVMAFATVLAFVVALALMLLVPALSYWPLLLLVLPGRLVRIWRRPSTRTAPG